MPPKRRPASSAAELAPAKVAKTEAESPPKGPYTLLYDAIGRHWTSPLLQERDDLVDFLVGEDDLSRTAKAFILDNMELLLAEDQVPASAPNRAKKAAARDCMIEIEDELDKVQEAMDGLTKKIRELHRVAWRMDD